MATYFNNLALRAQPDIPAAHLQPAAAAAVPVQPNDPFEAAAESGEALSPSNLPPTTMQVEKPDKPAVKSATTPTVHLSPAENKLPAQTRYAYLQQHFYREVKEKDSTTIIQHVPQLQQPVILQTSQGVKETLREKETHQPALKKEQDNTENEVRLLKPGPVEKIMQSYQPVKDRSATFLVPEAPVEAFPATPPVATASKSLSIGTITIEILPAEKAEVVHTIENRIIQPEPVAENLIQSRQLFGLAQI